MTLMNHDPLLQQAAKAVADADALLIGAGAGMGVDSGLPDFRGKQGFWQAYPPYENLGLGFTDLATSQWFTTDPAFAWGFYGHRLHLYRNTIPHDGFQILQTWTRQKSSGAFVYTSNVDGQFQRAAFDPERIVEVHGTIHWLQCLKRCGIGLFPAEPIEVAVDETTMRAREPLPKCPSCGALARPNILMFGDPGWDYSRSHPQEVRLNDWLRAVKPARLVILECGAGTAIPTVRRLCEQVAQTHNATLIRIDPRQPSVPKGHIGLAMGALEGLTAIQERMEQGQLTSLSAKPMVG